MKPLFLLIYFFCLFEATAQHNPVVVELFTSQGCSSCPAADRNLAEILGKAEREGKPVFGLSFHVDYWNHIGWEDPYSSSAFAERQRSYAQILGLGSVYTPQMIVNGKKEFVGSGKVESEIAVAEALMRQQNYQITISGLSVSDGVLRFAYALDKAPQGEAINVAVVQRDAENYVSRGENKGKKLHHKNVVRLFVTNRSRQSSQVKLDVPKGALEKASLIVYLQNKEWSVVGAAMKSIQ